MCSKCNAVGFLGSAPVKDKCNGGFWKGTNSRYSLRATFHSIGLNFNRCAENLIDISECKMDFMGESQKVSAKGSNS